jgi:hypothetical protein
MAFEQGNQFGKSTKRGKGKKTIIKEELMRLYENNSEIGIDVLQIIKELIAEIHIKENKSVSEYTILIQLLGVLLPYAQTNLNLKTLSLIMGHILFQVIFLEWNLFGGC